MAKGAVLAIRIIADASRAAKELGKAEKGVEAWSRKLDGPALAAAGALTAGFAITSKAASELEQSAGAVSAVFKENASEVEAFGDAAAQSVGLAKGEYQNLAAVLGSQLGNLGTPMSEVAGQTDELIRLGADLAAQYGGSTSEAVDALSSLLRGERDPIEKYAASITAADVAARLAANGQDKLTGEARKAAELQATLALLYEDTASAQGAFAREADTAAGATQIARAQYEDAAATIGTALLPMVAAVAGMVAKLSGLMTKNAKATRIIVGVLATLAAALVLTRAALSLHSTWVDTATARTKIWSTVTKLAAVASKIWAAAIRILNLAMKANPIGFVIGLIMLLVGAFVLAYKKSETFRKIVDGAMRGVAKAVEWVVDAIKRLIDWIGRLKFPDVGGWVSGIFGGSASRGVPGAPVPAPSPAVAGRTTMTGAPMGTTITVNGAVNPHRTAVELARLITGAHVRTGYAGVRV